MILVSVIVPYFKKKKFIKKTINSILSQTYKNLEVIIVYDDENRADLKLINNIKRSDNRIKLVINKKTLGAGTSRNIGIKKAKGEYIAFLDADDLWKKNKIKLQLNYMIKNNLLASHTDYEILSLNKQSKKIIKAQTFIDYKKLLFSCDIGLSTVMMNRKLISKTCKFPKLKTKEDFVLWLLILKRNIKIGGLNINLTKWRKLKNSLSSSIYQRLKDGFTLYNEYMKFNILKSFLYLFFLSVNSYKKK
tara:strand:+ start:225 stop:968 length:744 start_codon:yes stop_codon:yes gene_type:complete